MDDPYWRVPQGTEWCRSDGYGSRLVEGTENAPEGARLVTGAGLRTGFSIVETAGSLAGRGHRRLAGYALRRLAAQVEHDAQGDEPGEGEHGGEEPGRGELQHEQNDAHPSEPGRKQRTPDPRERSTQHEHRGRGRERNPGVVVKRIQRLSGRWPNLVAQVGEGQMDHARGQEPGSGENACYQDEVGDDAPARKRHTRPLPEGRREEEQRHSAQRDQDDRDEVLGLVVLVVGNDLGPSRVTVGRVPSDDEPRDQERHEQHASQRDQVSSLHQPILLGSGRGPAGSALFGSGPAHRGAHAIAQDSQGLGVIRSQTRNFPSRTVAASKNDAREALRKERGRSNSALPRARRRRVRAPRVSAVSSRSVTTSSRRATRGESVVWAGPGPGVQPSAAPRDGWRLRVAVYSPVSPRRPVEQGVGMALL